MSAFEDRLPTGAAWSSDGWKYFGEACDILVRNCGVLQLAVEQEWGGHGSTQKLDSALDDFIDNCKRLWADREGLHRETAEVFWEEVLENDFRCDLEGDETQATVLGVQLESVYARCSEGDFAEALKLIVEDDAKRGVRASAPDEADAAPALVEAADPDGWLPVASKKKKKDKKKAVAAAGGSRTASGGAGGDDDDDDDDAGADETGGMD